MTAELSAAADRLDECDATVVLLHYDDNGDVLGETQIPLAAPLADWLRAVEDRHPQLTDPDGDAMCQGCIERGAHIRSWPCDELEPALAVARVINGGAE